MWAVFILCEVGMKKLGLSLILLSSSVMAESVSIIKTNGEGTLNVCEDSLGGLMTSCKKEKVSIPTQIASGSSFYAYFLEERKGYKAGFEVADINFNSKKNSCTMQYRYSGGTATIFTKNCKVLKD